jgi:hypothetical protein
VRVLIGAAGVGLIGYGAYRIVTGGTATDPGSLGRWLAGGVLGHDVLIAAITAAGGAAVSRLVPARARAVVQGALLVAASLVLISLPVLSGRGGGNPSADPLDYPRNLALALLAVAAGAVIVYFGQRWRARDRRRTAVPGRGGGAALGAGPDAAGLPTDRG